VIYRHSASQGAAPGSAPGAAPESPAGGSDEVIDAEFVDVDSKDN